MRRGLFVVVAGLVLAVLPSRVAAMQPGPPPWRTGGRLAFTLDVASRPDSAGTVLELFLRIPPAILAELGRDEIGRGSLKAAVRLRGRGVPAGIDDTRELAVFGADSLLGQGRVALLRYRARPGPVKVRVRLEDQFSSQRGPGGGLRVQNVNATVGGETVIPGPQAGREISDIVFAWPDSGAAGASFVRAGDAVIPNPDRMYGLYATHVEAHFSARARPGDARPWRWVARVLDADGRAIAQHESTAVASDRLQSVAEFDMSGEPAGGYDLDLKAWQEGDDGALARRARFSVAWDAQTWAMSGADLADEAHFLLESEDEEQFERMQPGEQERWLEDYWRRRDPTPETAFNETLDLFHRRVAYANANFSRFGIEKGMFSDMGRVFIRYGEPSEVSREVVPAGDENLTNALYDIRQAEDRPTGVLGQRGDQRPYEIWVYEGEDVTPIDQDIQVTRARGRRRLLFLFVDDQGTGHYRLRYSSE